MQKIKISTAKTVRLVLMLMSVTGPVKERAPWICLVGDCIVNFNGDFR
jgi:hypothetical protein